MVNAVNASQSDGFIKTSIFDLPSQERGQVDTVLDQTSIEIHDVKGSIGAIERVDGPETFVSRGEKFHLTVGIVGLEGSVAFGDDVAPYQITCRFAHECIALVGQWELIATVDHWTTRAGVGSQASILTQCFASVTSIDPRIDARRPYLLAGGQADTCSLGSRQMRIPLQVGRRQNVASELVAVGIVIYSAVIVLTDAPLSSGMRGLTHPFTTFIAKLHIMVGTVNPVVHGPHEPIGSVFRIRSRARPSMKFKKLRSR